MKYNFLGHSDIKVSRICLGTMTWGEQNTQEDGFSQMDYALERGVNFWDTAELYSVPPKADTCGATETIIGHWFKKTGRRNNVVLASKIAGPGEFVNHIRQGQTKFAEEEIESALNESLQRLQTDYIDLYQLHWPARQTNFFGKLGFKSAAGQIEQAETELTETLSALEKQVQAGKIRQIGLSNETAWGAMKCLQLAKDNGWQKIVSVQNPYNLLNRSYEIGLAEVGIREKIGLLAYSPLGFGVLSGKYLNHQLPKNSRLQRFPHYDRYSSESAQLATQKYIDIAQRYQLKPAQMALAFINQQPFVDANIIGATNLQQLQENIESIELKLSDEILSEIDAVHQQISNPSP